MAVIRNALGSAAAAASASAESFDVGDVRQQEIVLDHALAKSSNVTSPEADHEDSFVSASDGLSGEFNEVTSQPAIKAAAPPVPSTLHTNEKENSPEIIDLDLEDDFFSMSYKPVHTEVKKKKRKKRRLVSLELSERSSSPAGSTVSQSAATPNHVDNTNNNNSNDNNNNNNNNNEPVVILTDDEDVSIVETAGVSASPPLRKRTVPKRPITPPPIDEETFRAMYKSTHSQSNADDLPPPPDLTEFDLQRRLAMLEKFASVAKPEDVQRSYSTDESPNPDELTVGSKAEDDRLYTVHITSFLPGSNDLPALTLKAKGNKKISSLVSKILSYLRGLNSIPAAYLHLYKESEIVLYWNKMKLMTYMKLGKLNIPESDDPTVSPEVEMALYTHEQARQIEDNERLERKKKEEQQLKDQELEKLLQEGTTRELHEIDDDAFQDTDVKEVDSRPVLPPKAVEPDEDDDSEYFKIGLKGEDNKKLIILVSPATKIADLVKYYLTQKELPLTSKVKLVFDDEDIEVSGTVADTELEEDFTVDVYIV
jgi:hypothetical protein